MPTLILGEEAMRRPTVLFILAALISAVMLLPARVEAETPGGGRTPGAAFRDGPNLPEMVVIPSGSFTMGSSPAETTRESVPDKFAAFERPQHKVSIGRSFAISRYPVTRGEFAAFVQETGYVAGNNCAVWDGEQWQQRPEANWNNPGFAQTERDPVVCVNWQDAQAYVTWLNGKARNLMSTGSDGPYRLPSEAEWEYAARGGKATARWWGEGIGSANAACFGCGSQWEKTTPVGSFRPNPFGLYDVLGNVWQWTGDCWNESYAGAPNDGSAWTTGNCDLRVYRSGSWVSVAGQLRSAGRSRVGPENRSNGLGFRLARTLQ